MLDTVNEMLRTTPKGAAVKDDGLARCIEACFECMQTCLACADACLGEDQVANLIRCIRLNLDCADVCSSAGRLLTRQQEPNFGLLRMTIELCELACATCGEECERHASHHEHCRICAESCRCCEQACQQLLAVFPAAQQPSARH